MAKQRLAEIRKIRLEKAEKLRELGIDPYPAKVDGSPKPIKKALESLGKVAQVAGRLVGWRSHGNVTFADLKDESGVIQLWFQKNNLGEDIKILRYFDIGDFLYAKGKVVKTAAGEISVDVAKFQLLTKSIRPLPSTWSGLKDVEEKYRKRYLDLLVNPGTKTLLDKRWMIEKEIRLFLWGEGYTEVETPTLQELYGGTNAKPFTTHMNALSSDFYLRIAPELYLKRLVVGGYEKVFEIARNFRNEGIDITHQPEFTMIEWYEAYANYENIMDTTEKLTQYLVKKMTGGSKVSVKGKDVDISGKWPRISMVDAIKKYINLDVEKEKDEKLKEVLKENNIGMLGKYSRGKAIFAIFEHLVTDKLIGPIWIINYPIEVCPLQKKLDGSSSYAERFEGYIGGIEYADGWTEINDPVDQRERFVTEQKHMREGDEEAHPLDENFIESLEYGMPPLGGIGIGIDRLVMFLTDTWKIREVIAFPTLRPKFQKVIKQPERKIAKMGKLGNYGKISLELAQAFPGVSYAFTVIEGVEIKKRDDDLERLKKETIKRREALTLEQIKELEPIKVYREMLKKTGIKTNSRRPSPEALLRRIVQGKGLYTINTAVDAYNLAVMETGVGLGGFDFEKISPPVALRFSKEGEEMLLLGDREMTKTKAGEIVYADKEKLLTLDLNYRDIDETKITLNTKSIMLFADGGPGIDPKGVKNALKLGAEYIQKFCGGKIKDIILVQ